MRPALSLAEEILAGGESSRLYQSLVYEQQVAQSVSCNADLHEDLGLLRFSRDPGQRKTGRRRRRNRSTTRSKMCSRKA